MKVFELHFNPKAKNVVFDSFVYEPENASEKNLGSLYMVGQISNAIDRDAETLYQIAQAIKKEYYSNPQRSADAALKESLKKTNEFLNRMAKEGKVDWLGNLNFAVLSIKEAGFSPITFSSNNVPFALNFAQTGEIKILLLRGREILDISQNLEFQTAEAYPLKIFENIVSGKLVAEDKLIILTKEIFEYLGNKNSIGSFVRVTDEKVLNEILKPLRKEISEISGVLLFLGLTKTPQKTAPQLKKKVPHLPKLTLGLKWPSLFNIPKTNFSKFHLNNRVKKEMVPAKAREIVTGPSLWRKISLVILLILLLTLTFFTFEREREKDINIAEQILAEVESQKSQAQNFLVFGEKEQANRLLQSAWIKISPLLESSSPLPEKTVFLKESIEKELAPLNQLEKITNLELVFEIPTLEIGLVPQSMILSESPQEEKSPNFYLSNHYSSNLYRLSLKSKEGEVLKADRNLKLAAYLPGSILFFSAPDTLIQYQPESSAFQELSLSFPECPEPNFIDFGAYYNSLYFLEAESGEIVRFDANAKENQTLVGENWISPTSEKKAKNGKSIAIDGSIWILNNQNQIDRYRQGEYKESFGLDIFPFVKNPTKIWTTITSPYLYLLEPVKNRIIILNKHGETVKQYQSEKFDKLIDFVVSEDGKTIYLLNNCSIYKISADNLET